MTEAPASDPGRRPTDGPSEAAKDRIRSRERGLPFITPPTRPAIPITEDES